MRPLVALGDADQDLFIRGRKVVEDEEYCFTITSFFMSVNVVEPYGSIEL